jgi:hypothetical protein
VFWLVVVVVVAVLAVAAPAIAEPPTASAATATTPISTRFRLSNIDFVLSVARICRVHPPSVDPQHGNPLATT